MCLWLFFWFISSIGSHQDPDNCSGLNDFYCNFIWFIFFLFFIFGDAISSFFSFHAVMSINISDGSRTDDMQL